MKKLIIFIAMMLLFNACSNEYEERLKISATTWIGYTPLFYAQERGWLEPLNIKLINVSSLAENMYLYQAGNSDAYVGTQYEYEILNSDMNTLSPIMMFDRSNGGDLVMSNVSIEELQNTQDAIDVYLELDSINNTLLKDFLKIFQLQEKKIIYHNKDQAQIKLLKASKDKATIIVTYIPYNIQLEKQGFKELASTKDNLSLLVVDAMFTKNEVLIKHKKQFVALKELVNKALEDLHKNPKSFYETIKPYMADMSYEEFLESLNDIIWINSELSNELKVRLNHANFPTRDLL